ncbi:MAG: hypothetical protein QF467_00455 [SAR202 cluster bacterium]|nr:hypothetical protein [SAR202 cluster bacterium]
MESTQSTDSAQTSSGRKRTRIVRPYPIHTLEEALTIASTIQEANAGLEFDRELLARAMGTTPASSGFTMRLNSSAKYGLTQGGYNDPRIGLAQRGEAIVAPKGDDELRQALVDAALQPDLFAQFYRLLDGKRLPEDTYAQNMLQRELGIHPDLAGECLGIVKANGLFTGILRSVQGALQVDLQGPPAPYAGHPERDGDATAGPAPPTAATSGHDTVQGGKIFIGHDGSAESVGIVSAVLEEFNIPYGTVLEPDVDLRPVPAEVAREMRECMAAVLVFAAPEDDESGATTPMDRIMFLLGASSVLYGDRIVILRERGFEPAYDTGSLPTVVFDRDSPEHAGLALLRELHRAGVIEVTS